MKKILNPALLLLRPVLLFLAVAGSIGSCKKENSGNQSPQQQETAVLTSTQSDAEADVVFNDVFDNVMGVNNDVGMQGTGVFGRMAGREGSSTAKEDSVAPCFTITVNKLNPGSFFPVQVIIDFGEGCEGKDGRIRKGKLVATYTGRLIIPGNAASVTFEDFYLDSIKVEGTVTITNSGTLAARQFTLDVQEAKLSKPGGNYTQWSAHRTITQTEGMITPDFPLDDAFSIEGNSQGLARQNNLLVTWQTSITTPLLKRFLCHWFVQGTVKAVLSNSNNGNQWTAILDYGNGNCDRKATITINGVEHEISLH
ncbi:MAG TPA: hypothetical protein VFS36_07095 [Chitinophagaceae bacterium]|nr:hypothetical protein [Chitinophagaceae bacterium]